MNHKQLVQDCIDGRESCSNAATMILNEIESLQESLKEILTGVEAEKEMYND
jgi:hypothetical protein